MSMAKTSPNLDDKPVATGQDGLPIASNVSPALVDGVPAPVELPPEQAKGDPLVVDSEGKSGVFDRIRDVFANNPEGRR